MSAFIIAANYKAALLHRAAEVVAYNSWNPEFCVDQLKEVATNFPKLKLTEFSEEDLVKLNFGKYGFPKNGSIKLIPLWLVPILDPEEYVLGIDGIGYKLKDADLDTRGGYIAYGI